MTHLPPCILSREERYGTAKVQPSGPTQLEPPIFPQSLANVNVHGNTFKTRGPVAIGTVGDTVAPGISFTGNTYLMDDLARAVWAYGTYPLSRAQWQGKGQDQAGVFKTW